MPSILNESECVHIRNGIWNFFERISKTWTIPIRRNNPTSWKEYAKLQPLHGMLMQNYHVGHAQVSWDVRQNERIIDIFSKIWECTNEELIVSFDGLGFGIPPEITNCGWQHRAKSSSFHTDQSFTTPDFNCVQSWVTAEDVCDGDATLAFYSGSHMYHKEFADTFSVKDKKDCKKDWYRLNEEELQFYRDRGCEPKRIRCPKGSMVLWDSRTIHCGGQPIYERTSPKFRYIIYLCYLPRNKCSDKNMKKRIDAFKNMKSMSHNAVSARPFGDQPARDYGKIRPEITKIEPPILNEIGLQLIGATV